MGLLEEAREIFRGEAPPVWTRNYFFEIHVCAGTGQPEKVPLSFKLSTAQGDAVVTFGRCPHCGTVFAHKDFESGDR
jgi:hypothetical protein